MITGKAAFLKSCIIFVFLVAASSCADVDRNRLRLTVENGNKECPVKMGATGIMEYMRYDIDSNDVALSYALNENLVNIPGLASATEEQKTFLAAFLRDDEQQQFLDLLVKADASLSLVFRGMESRDSVSLRLSPEELREIAAEELDEDNDMRQLEAMVAISNARCPELCDTGLTFTGIHIEDGYLNYNFDYDPLIYHISPQAREQMERNATDNLRQELTGEDDLQLRLMKSCRLGARYYYNAIGGAAEPLVITITPGEIAAF